MYTDRHLVGKYETRSADKSIYGFMTQFQSWTMSGNLNFKIHDGSYSIYHKSIYFSKNYGPMLHIVFKKEDLYKTFYEFTTFDTSQARRNLYSN